MADLAAGRGRGPGGHQTRRTRTRRTRTPGATDTDAGGDRHGDGEQRGHSTGTLDPTPRPPPRAANFLVPGTLTKSHLPQLTYESVRWGNDYQTQGCKMAEDDRNSQKTKAAIGDYIISYNQAEHQVRQVLICMNIGYSNIGSEGVYSSFIFVSELGGNSIINALKSFSKNVVKGTMKRHIDHLANLFQSVLQQRNFFVHGLWSIDEDEKSERYGIVTIHSISSKSGVKTNIEEISIDDIEKYKSDCVRLLKYASAITGHYFAAQVSGVRKDFVADFPELPTTKRKPSFPGYETE